MWFKKKNRLVALYCPLCGKMMRRNENTSMNRLAVGCDRCRIRVGQEDIDRMKENWRTFGLAEALRTDMFVGGLKDEEFMKRTVSVFQKVLDAKARLRAGW